MGEFVGPNIGKDKPGQRPLLRDILLETAFKPGRAISSEIDQLDLGVFSEEALLLANACFADPDKRNFGKFVYITGSKKVLVPKSAFREVIGEVLIIRNETSNIPREAAERLALDDHQYIGMAIHTSKNLDYAFSSTGLAILIEPDSALASSSCLFVTGRTQNMLFFRGQNTPQLSEVEVERKLKLWVRQLEDRIRQFTKSGMSTEEKQEVVGAAQDALLKQICQKYDLRFFAGSSDGSVVTRQSP